MTAFIPPPAPQPVLLTVNEFCDRFRVSRSAFYRQVKDGRLAVLKIGGATRIADNDAAAWLAALPRGVAA